MGSRLLVALCSLVVAGVAMPAPASADIYQCEMPDGTLHYTQSRPPKAKSCKRIVREKRRSRRSSAGPSSSRRRSRGGATRDPQRYSKYDAHIRQAARLYQLPESFIRAVMKVESDFTPDVVSHAGAMGLMQLMPHTAARLGVRNPFDPRENILGGARYLRMLANQFNGDLVLTIAAYNAGEGAVLRHSGVPPYRETRRYVKRVLSHYYSFRSEGSQLAQASASGGG